MKHITRTLFFLLITLVIALALPGKVSAQSQTGDKVVFGDTYRLNGDETLNGNLTVLGGAVTLEKGSVVTGDVTLLGGALEINGTVDGTVSIVGGSVTLGDTAYVHGDVTTMGGTLHRADNARVDGRLVNGAWNPINMNFPRNLFPTNFWNNFAPVGWALRYFGNALLLAALAMLVVMFLPKHTERVAHTILAQPAVTGGLGLLSLVVIPTLLILLTITIILIPVSLLGVLVVIAAVLFGWIALGLEVGRRIGVALKVQWHDALLAGVGTLVMSLVVNGIGAIACIGWIAPFLVGLFGLGGVIITRFGTQVYPTAGIPTATAAPAAQIINNAVIPSPNQPVEPDAEQTTPPQA
jgi:cytoskeletal protein CcmA (bactofilin family)